LGLKNQTNPYFIKMTLKNSLLKLLKVVLLLAVALGPTGCASDDSNLPTPSDSTPSKEDLSHGWGPTDQPNPH
jgi:hypothetical protein